MGVETMRRREIKAPFGDIDTRIIHDWTDDSLEDDEVDLNEWAFMQGYYEEN